MSVQLETRGDHVYVNNNGSSSNAPSRRTSIVISENKDNDTSQGSPHSLKERDGAESDFELLANDVKKRSMPRPANKSPQASSQQPNSSSETQSTLVSPLPSTTRDEYKEPTEEEMLERSRKKLRLIHELKQRNGNPRKLTVDSPMSEIVMEHEFANNQKQTEVFLSLAQTALAMACDGINKLNSAYDPFGVNMDEWKNDVTYKIKSKGEFDDPLLQIISENRDNLTISPAVQIALGLGSSFYSHVNAKRTEMHMKKQLMQQAEIMKRQEDELKAHRMQTRRHEKEAWERSRAANSLQSADPVPDLQGPALTAEEMRKAMEATFVPDNSSEPDPPANPVTEQTTEPQVAQVPPPPQIPSPVASPVAAEKTRARKAPAKPATKAPAKRRAPKASTGVALDL